MYKKAGMWTSVVKSRLKGATCIAFAVALSGGCTPDVERGGETNQLKCERDGYPCSAADVEEEVALQRLQIAVEGSARMYEQEANVVADWVADQPGVVDVRSSSAGLMFRIEGSRWGTILKPRAVSQNGPMQLRSSELEEETARSEVVEGDQAFEARDRKRALILSPVEFEFGGQWNADDGAIVRDVLENTRGYRGNVDYRKNEAAGLEAFSSWDDRAVVHVSTHGICIGEEETGSDTSNGCFPLGLFTGEKAAATVEVPYEVTDEEIEEDATLNGALMDAVEKVSQEGGVGVSVDPLLECETATPTPSCDMRLLYVVDADFFAAQYPNGLENTFVFLNACESLGTAANGIGRTLIGPGGAFAGWTNPVVNEDAAAAAEELYGEYLSKGLTVADSFKRMQNKRSVDPEFGTAELHGFGYDGHARIREVVTMKKHADVLEDGEDLTALMRAEDYTDDGRDDVLEFTVQVDGVTEGREDRYKVSFELNGEEVGEARPVKPSDKVDEFQYEFDVELELGQDLKRDESYTLTAKTTLGGGEGNEPDKGFSVHQVENVKFQFWCDAFIFPATKDENGDWLATLTGHCSQYNSQLQEDYLYGMCVCGQRPLEEDGVVEACDILCVDDGSGRCTDFSGPGVVPEAYREESNCFKESWTQSGFGE
jgi:hypothetical protein